MPLIVVDARGITFRPSGARTRFLGLYSAMARIAGEIELLAVVSKGRRAREICHRHGIPTTEHPAQSGRNKFLSSFRLTGDPFRWADLIHRETYPVPFDQRQPVFLTIHDIRSTADTSLAASRLKGFYERRLLPLVSYRTARIIAVSESTSRDIQNYLGAPAGKILVVPNAIDAPQQETDSDSELRDDRPFALAFGHMERRKNLRSILPAMQIACTDPHFPVRRLVLAGRDFGEAERLRREYDRLTQPRFELEILTDVGDRLREQLLRHASALLSPSLLEGFGLVPLEALARGTPVVVSDIPAAHEVLEDAALWIDPNDSRQFADQIRAACIDNAQRRRTLENARRVLTKYSWEVSAGKLLQAYKEVLGAKTQPESTHAHLNL